MREQRILEIKEAMKGTLGDIAQDKKGLVRGSQLERRNSVASRQGRKRFQGVPPGFEQMSVTPEWWRRKFKRMVK